MKIFFLMLLSITLVFAKSDKISNIPLSTSVFIDNDANVCDFTCMNNLLNNGEIFTFLSKYNNLSNEDVDLAKQYAYFKRIFRIYSGNQAFVRVAILVPQKSIRRYSISTVNSSIAYLLSKDNNFEIKVFNSIDEKPESIIKELKKIKEDNFTYLIAPVTQEGASTIVDNSHGLIVYIPTVEKSFISQAPSNIIFGGIDYTKQINELLKYSNDKIAYFGDGSSLSKSLNQRLLAQNQNIVYKQQIGNSKTNFKRIFKNNKSLINSTIFMNTPLIKTSLLSSQLRVYEIKPYIILSTQINYNPMILTLTQYEDRKNLLIANSIGKATTEMQELNNMFESDIKYDWVNYSTTIGIDYFYTNFFEPKTVSNFVEKVDNGQVQYDISIIQPKRYSFKKMFF